MFLIYKSDTVNELAVHNFIFNIVASIVQTFIKSWNQLLYSWVIEVCRQPEIKDGLPLLCLSWTSVLPSENSWHHFVTFYRFITLP